ncbi:cyclic nucleotide-binding domain-containing protein [uncultured Croceitalea sp.]|uniref:Crp/Fnr family transcriptional regulator n=1 Tax=uncultured Croceitalea sp. TaxID=1798908 RepID=UPI0033067367
MEKSFLEIINKIGKFNDEELLLLKNELQSYELKKGDNLLKVGEVCSSLWFVVSGSFYEYGINPELDKVVIDLYTTNDWVINHKSFSTRKPSEYAIQAYKKSVVHELTIDSVHKLISKSQSFLTMGRILEESTSRIDFFDNNSTPDDKYDFILKNKPQLLQEFPQKIIASYLKITPETLSRVRKRLSKN